MGQEVKNENVNNHVAAVN